MIFTGDAMEPASDARLQALKTTNASIIYAPTPPPPHCCTAATAFSANMTQTAMYEMSGIALVT